MDCARAADVMRQIAEGKWFEVTDQDLLAAVTHVDSCGCETCHQSEHWWLYGKPKPVEVIDIQTRQRVA